MRTQVLLLTCLGAETLSRRSSTGAAEGLRLAQTLGNGPLV
jgi:hypothetical protein